MEYQEKEQISKLCFCPEDKKSKDVLFAELNSVGWELAESEGYSYIRESGKWFQKHFDTLLPDAWKIYLDHRKQEIREGFSDDAVLLISWEALRIRITLWENFLNQHPSFPLEHEIMDRLNIYIRTFFAGTSNSWITNGYYKDTQLSDEVKAAFEKFLIQNKSSRFYSLVEGYYKILERNSFIVNEELDFYLEEHGFNIKESVPLY